jgi:hypothetical protein
MSLEDFEDLDKTHKKIRDNYKKIKSIHLEKLGSKILKNEEKFRKLKEKKINNNFLKHF